MRCSAVLCCERSASRSCGLKDEIGSPRFPLCHLSAASGQRAACTSSLMSPRNVSASCASSSNLERQQRQLRFAEVVTESDLCRYVLRTNRQFIRAVILGIPPRTLASSDHGDTAPGGSTLSADEAGAHVGDSIALTKQEEKLPETYVPEIAAIRRFLEESTPQTRLLQGSLER